ncbi:MAG: methylated-DNA--[protein]-cysteine S-methyltransferase [Neisseria sp.]|uniref:methylated-DNA--[protein]-cysteine S-methyltransferase n=1 Tax=unclassified Neisseria TaxID=2623750 RepID=UPI0008A977FC|nr:MULTISPECIES: methylated-DNA--[protein]-cysteine S-methyltransferase [unclassified Neisseria]MBF1269837.1 methylated-DNA--[protein]-cysteine S-methyltransferase [Neisseria sp.]OHR15885.1 cysteine methyltransferase [Neisseria sp. HMSC078C12]
MITLPSLNELPSKWNEIRERLETDFSTGFDERLTGHEAKQFEQDFIDRIGCAPEEYVRIRRAIRLLETRYPDSPNELTVAALATPLGEMLAVFGGKGLCLLEFVGQKQLEQEITAVQKALHGQFIFQENEQTQLLRQELDLYFQGRLKVFATPLEMIGTAFQQQVWNALLTIPYGETRSYKEQAQQLGNPKAIRAVAAANGQNKVSILIPCHRVIGSDGKLTGYAGGLNRKQSLLALERGEVQTALF